MLTKRKLMIVLVASIVMLAMGSGLQLADSIYALPSAQEPAPTGVTIPYPARLSDEAGQVAADGAYDFTFALYEAPAGGEPLWAEIQEGVIVKDGAFLAILGSAKAIPIQALQGGERWLEIAVRGPDDADFTTLSPRQQVSAASPIISASSTSGVACPHDHWGETWTGAGDMVLNLINTGTGNGLKVSNNSQFATILAYNAGSGSCVYGSSTGGKGIHGFSTTGIAVYGQSSSGTGVCGESPSGTGVWGKTTATSGTTTGVWGLVSSPQGYGVYGMNTAAGTGVYGFSAGGVGVNARGANAVVGISETPGYAAVFGRNDATSGAGSGIWGEAKSADGAGGYFKNTAGNGVLVESAGKQGVYVKSAGYSGVAVDSASQSGVYVVSAGGDGVRVYQAGDNGVDVYSAHNCGLYVSSAGTHGVTVNSAVQNGVTVASAGNNGVYVRQATNNGLYVGPATNCGLRVEPVNQIGVWTDTARGDGHWGLYTESNIRVHMVVLGGGIKYIMQNGSGEPLEPGDVVVFSGLGAPLKGKNEPVARVAKAATANSTAVAGVVVSRYNIEAPSEDPADWDFTPAGPVPPEGYLLVAVQGPAQVKVSALGGPIRPGDLLSSADRPGYAVKAAEVSLQGVKIAVPGTVFGKALEALDAAKDSDLLWAWITLP